MFLDSLLKLNCIYWAEIIDSSFPNLFGKQLQVKFTGIAFRNVKYLSPDHEKPINLDDEKEQARQKFINKRASEKPDSVFMLSQIKIFREVKKEEFNLLS